MNEVASGPKTDRQIPHSCRAAEAAMCAGLHWFRKGYYQGSNAQWVCVVCGLEASDDELVRVNNSSTSRPSR